MSGPGNYRYDVTIAGAGPSGTILAYQLAKKGLKVQLLEKSVVPRKKTCAGGITVRAASLLPFNFSEIIENTIFGVRLSFKTVIRKVRFHDRPLAYMVSRDKFDSYLVQKACEAGVIFQDNTEVQGVWQEQENVRIKTSRETIITPLLVGADGANSTVVRSAGLKSGFEYGLGLNAHISVSKEDFSSWDGIMGLDYGIPGGYAWIFPKKGYLAVGAGGSYKVARQLRAYTIGLVRAYNLGEIDRFSLKGHLMPVRKRNAPLTRGRILLVGDAAGVIDPLTGEGIFYGLKSSYLAAVIIQEFLEGKIRNLGLYNDSVNRELFPELKAARTIQKLNSAFPRLFFHFLQENDRFFRAFCGLLRGEKTYQYLVSRLSPPLRLLFRLI